MTSLSKEALIKELEESVNRLEQARSNTIEIHNSGDAGLESIDIRSILAKKYNGSDIDAGRVPPAESFPLSE